MQIRHVALFRWADHVDAAHVERVRQAFDELASQVPGVRHHVHGADLGLSDDGADFVVVADFDSVEAWRGYRDHPTHVLLDAELVTGHVIDRSAAQFATGPGTSAPVADPATVESDDELLARARRAAMAEMEALLAEPDELG